MWSLVQFRSVTQSCPTLWDPMDCNMQDSLSITNSWSLFRLMSIKSVMPTSHLIFWHPLLLMPSIIPSIRLFSNESVICIMWPKYWSFSFSISPSNEYSGLISLGLTGLISLQSKLLSRVFSSTTVQKQQFSSFLNGSDLTSTHDYWKKNIALTRQNFVSKVMSLFF